MKHVITRLALLVSLGAAFALAQSPDLNELKAKLAQLEQMMQELRSQIDAAEKTPAPLTQAAVAPQPQTQTQVPPPQVPAEHIGDLTRLRDSANDEGAASARINNEPMDRAMRGYFRLPGTGTLIKLSGFVKTDLYVDTNQAGTFYGQYVPATFPSSPQPHTVNATVSMRPSRFSSEFLQPVGTGDDNVKAYLEFDFFGDPSRNSFRMRHYYAQYKNVLVGQTWSSFGDPDVWPDTLEFEGPPAILGLRNPMMRYTQPLNKSNSIGIAAERTGTDTPGGTPFGTPIGSSLWPDLVGFYRYENERGHLYFAFINRSVGGVIPNSTLPDLKNHVQGYGGTFSGAWGSSSDNVVFQATIGKGISNYYNDNWGLESDVGFGANGKLVATPSGSGLIGYQHHWSKVVRSTFSYSYLQINNTAGDPATNYHISHYATGNIIFQPWTSCMFGAEYIYGSLERKDGFKWVAPRIQASVTYYLNKYPKE